MIEWFPSAKAAPSISQGKYLMDILRDNIIKSEIQVCNTVVV